MHYIIRTLRKLTDPRQPWKIKHDLTDILAICIIAVMCGAQSSLEIQMFAEMRKEWFGGFLSLTNGIPNRLTFERVLRIIDSHAFSKLFTEIMQHIQTRSKGSVVAIDGKCCYSRGRNGKCENVLYMVSAWQQANAEVLGQVETEEKSNEITAIPRLLSMLSIEDAIVTIDAIGCQKTIVKQIVRKNHADYVIGLKANQQIMQSEMQEYAAYCLREPSMREAYDSYTTREKGHGRFEKRQYFLFHDLSWFNGRAQWEGLRSLVMVKSTREVGAQPATSEVRFYISSLTDVQQAAHAVRAHWGIENGLHWVLDVVFREDQWATKAANPAANLAIIRKLALSFLRKAEFPGKTKLSAPLKMWKCALDLDSLNTVLFSQREFS